MKPFTDAAELALYLQDFGVDCTGPAGAVFRGIFDEPGENVRVGDVLITDSTPSLLVASTDAANLVKGHRLVIDGTPYVCKDFNPQDDGAFTRINLNSLR